MKKLSIILLILAFISTVSFAQDFAKKGVIELGGSILFSSTTEVYDGETADDSQTDFSFMPLVGYFIIDGFEVGVMPVFSSTSFGDNSTSTIGIYLTPQYHFDMKSNIYPYIGAMVGYNSLNIDNGTNDESFSGLSFGGLAGLKVQLGKSALANLGINYFMYTFNPEDWDKDRVGANQLAISAGVSIFFGK